METDQLEQEVQDSVHVDDREDDPRSSEIDQAEELVQQRFLLDADIVVQSWLDINRFVVNDFVRYEVGETLDEEES